MDRNPRELLQIMTRRFGLLNKTCCSIGNNDISLVQSHILYEIDRGHQPSMQQVADTLGMDITTFSRQVQTLIKKKLVKKTALPEDRRVYILTLTVEGKFVASTIDRMMNDYLDEVFSFMNEFEKETVIRSLKLLNDSMQKSKMCCTPMG
ncbi:MarR family winged helix-turn-helix transcriptional regulator [Paenibacillus sp. sptzw28]|uniref:MarR family winged helix-turn-helix transcriptional regulator n=1 Tax=Paenibacillus sp. sptzw28 TaxID=715179 RepID=UPI001C6EF883|nr:MarR family winged helix-turn-helix transcriptional regulator [Paenibacillus sp. sptzw28]QYR22472.1 MarR family winged helix-turn-helix transcriptional regulator [Paenibacillus sp. sptzw28]